MEKVVRLINILDSEVVDKLVYLDRLVRFYSKFLETWKAAEVTSDGTVVRVKFWKVDSYGYEAFTEREFPMEDIDKRIRSYKEKIKRVWIKRHDNPRIQRAKEIRKWEKYIEECQDSDAITKTVNNTEKSN